MRSVFSTKKIVFSTDSDDKPASANWFIETINYESDKIQIAWGITKDDVYRKVNAGTWVNLKAFPVRASKRSGATNYTFLASDKDKNLVLWGASGNAVIEPDTFVTDDELWGEVENNQKTFVAGTGVTLRYPDGQGLIAPTGSRFIVKFQSPNDALVTIIKPYSGGSDLSASPTLNFGSISAGSAAILTTTVTGAALGDVVAVSAPSSVYTSNNCTVDAWVSDVDEVSVRIINNGGSGVDPDEGTYKIKVFK